MSWDFFVPVVTIDAICHLIVGSKWPGTSKAHVPLGAGPGRPALSFARSPAWSIIFMPCLI